MDRATKATAIGEIKGRFDKMTSAVFLDFKGMTVEEVSKLRTEFRKQGVEYRVVKKAIADKSWAKSLDGTLKGFTGVAFAYEDPSAAAKVVKAFRKDNEKLQVKAGLVDGQLLDGKAVEAQLATMPGKNELRATLLATMQAPLQQFVALLQAPAQNFAYLLSAKEREGDKK